MGAAHWTVQQLIGPNIWQFTHYMAYAHHVYDYLQNCAYVCGKFGIPFVSACQVRGLRSLSSVTRDASVSSYVFSEPI
jgi:hypothetical protein